jgi:hypothetical protein
MTSQHLRCWRRHSCCAQHAGTCSAAACPQLRPRPSPWTGIATPRGAARAEQQ